MKVVILGEHQGDGIRYEMYLSAPAGGLAQMIRNPEGNWVGYAEYAALQAENERLTKERDHYQWASTNDGIACNERARENQELENQIADLKAENDGLQKELHMAYNDYEAMQRNLIHLNGAGLKLQAENERLRKAGDALLECHKIRDDLAYSIQEQSPDVSKAMLAWLSAKETQS